MSEPIVHVDVALIHEILDLAYWGPRGPEGGNSPDSPTYSHADGTLRIGWIVGLLGRYGYKPTPRPEPPSAA
jgi:hypothetical protein